MAKGGEMCLSSFKEQFDDQLTCSVCLDQYTNPKTLPCLHSFCSYCIEQVPMEIKDGKYYTRCPTCHVDHLLPQGGANSLPNDFKINSLLDLRKTLVSTKITIAPPDSQITCPQHNDLLTVYCETCCKVICRDCTISTEHNKHTFCLVSERYPKHHKQILHNLDLVKHKLADMNTAMTHLDTREREVVKQGENVKERINAHAQQLIDNIQLSRTHLTQQVNTIVQRKTQTLEKQRQQAQKLYTQLKTCQDTIEHRLKEWSQQQILAQKITMMNEMNKATQHVDPAVFQPIEDANIQYGKTEKEMGSITSFAYCKATLNALPCTTKQQASATLALHSQDGSPFSLPPSLISSKLTFPGNKHSIMKCPITKKRQPGKYNISFTPSTRNDQLIVQVGGVDVPDSPFTLPVIPPSPKMRGEPFHIITGMEKPCGIAVCDNGDIVVAENGADCITILNKNGERVKTFGQFNCPRRVVLSIDGHILVTDNHRLQKLTTDGVCVISVGSSKIGCCQLQFNTPQGIAVHPTTGHIFVADFGNNRIQVFSNKLSFSHIISPTRLSLSRQFHRPRDIAIDNEGYLYITDNGSQCIFKISGSTGKCNSRFVSPDQKVINPPSSLTLHNNLVYVRQLGDHEYKTKNKILVFDTEGKFQHSFGEKALMKHHCPHESISTDILGNLYISDYDNNRIIVI